MTPAQAIHAAVCVSLTARGARATGKAVAALVGERQPEWSEYSRALTDPGTAKLTGWLESLDAAGHPMRLWWDGEWKCEEIEDGRC
jgi:hypothetical protein